ncbi:hypothetical protein OAC50_00750 [bacterium]|nr:hypothetical protein [bacterium]
MGLDKIIVGQLNSATANAFKLNIAVDGIQDLVIDTVALKIEDEIPIPLPFNISVAAVLKQEQQIPKTITKELLVQEFPPYSTAAIALKQIPEPQKKEISDILDEIEGILNKNIEIKNTLSGALNTVLKPIDTVSKLVSTLNKVIPTLKTVVTIIKALPFPVSIPPGVGIPVNIINGFTNTLITLDDSLSKLGGPIDAADQGIKGIQSKIKPIIAKLSILDPIFDKATQVIILIRILLDFGGDLENLTPEKIKGVGDAVLGRQAVIKAIAPGPLTSDSSAANALANAELDKSLQPGSLNPLIYKGFKLELQSDPDNQYSFPSRRIYGKFQNEVIENSLGLNNTQNTLLGVDARLLNSLKDSDIYNLPAVVVTEENDDRITELTQGHPYSFSSSTQVLLSEIYYEIDQLILGKESIIESENENVIRDNSGKAVGVIYDRPGVSLLFTPGANIDFILKAIGLRTTKTTLTSDSGGTTASATAITQVMDPNLEPLPKPTDVLSNNQGIVFKNYVEYALDKNIVRDAKGGLVGRILGEYGVILKSTPAFATGRDASTSDVTISSQDYHNDIQGIFGDQAQIYVTSRGGTVFQSYKDANPPGTGKILANAQLLGQGGLSAAGPLTPIVYYPFGVAGAPKEVRRNTDGSYFRFYASNPDPSYANTALFLSASGDLGATNSNQQLSASTGWFSITPPPTTPFNSYGTTPGEVRRNTEVFQPGGYQVSNAYKWNNTTYEWEDNFTGVGLGGSNTTYFPDPFDRVGNYIGEYAYISTIDTNITSPEPKSKQYIKRYKWGYAETAGPNSNEKGYKWVWQGYTWVNNPSETLPQTNGKFTLMNINLYGRFLNSSAANNPNRYVEVIPLTPQGQAPLIKYNSRTYT